MSSSVAPAADVDCDADRGRVTSRILDVDAHNGVVAAHALGSETDRVDAVLEKLLHLGSVCVVIVGSDGTHQSLLGIESCRLHGSSDADTNQKRRTGVEAVGCHSVEDELCDAFVAFPGHQNRCVAGQCAAAACHICVDLTLVGVRNDVPPDSRCALADIFARVVLVKSLHRELPSSPACISRMY